MLDQLYEAQVDITDIADDVETVASVESLKQY
jgi:hypothetical protein